MGNAKNIIRMIAALVSGGFSVLFIGGTCSYGSTDGGMEIGIAPAVSIAGVIFALIFAFIIKQSPWKESLFFGIYTLLLTLFTLYVNYASKVELTENYSQTEVDILPASGFSVALCALTVIIFSGLTLSGLRHDYNSKNRWMYETPF